MTVFPYIAENGSSFAIDYYIKNIFIPGKGYPSYETWLANYGGILKKTKNSWVIVFENDEDAIAFKLMYL